MSVPIWIGSRARAPRFRSGVISCFITTSPTNVAGVEPRDVDRQRIAGVHAERRRVDDEVEAGGVVRVA